MTEFGRTHLDTWFRTRIIVFAAGFVLALAIRLALSSGSLILLALLAAEFVFSIFGQKLTVRFGAATLVRALIVLDVAVVAVATFGSGGIDGGYAALYVPVVLVALLMLGRQAALQVTILCIICFSVQFALDLLGINAYESRPPILIEYIGQISLLILLTLIAFILTRVNTDLTTQLQEEKGQAEAERVQANQAQAQWALVNNVALRVQASTTPEQVYTTIAQELERVDLHSIILEWAQPGVSFRIAHASYAQLQEIADFVHMDLAKFELPLRDTPELAQALDTHAPVLVSDVPTLATRILPQIPRSSMDVILRRMNAHTLIFAPMVIRGQNSGVFLVWGKSLSASDLAPLAALAQQAASALDKARLLTEQQKRAAQLELVSALAAKLNAAENAEQIIRPLVREIGERFGYEVVAIALVDTVRQDFYTAASHTALASADFLSPRQPREVGILGVVARTGEPYLARDVTTDPCYFAPNPQASPIRSEYAVPLRVQDKTIGILDIQSTRPDAFDDSDRNALGLLAGQVSTALARSRMLVVEQKRAAQLALVSEIAARAAAFSDPDVIVRTMVELVQQRFGYHHVCVSLHDPAQNELEQGFAAGPNAQLYTLGFRWSVNTGLMGTAVRARQTIYSGDLVNDPRYMPDPDKFANSALCVPLVSGLTVLGVLDIESTERNAFDTNDIGAMETLANQMAAALEKARSLQAERRRAGQMALVNRVASRTARLIPSKQLVSEAVQMIRAQFGYYNVSVLVADGPAPRVRLEANAGGLSPLLTTPQFLTGGIIGYVSRTGNTYLCPVTTQDPRYVSPFPPGMPDPVRSELTVPLRRGENIIGVLDIQSEEPHSFSAGDITALEALADQLAGALENARLYEAEKGHAAQLEAVRVLSLNLTAEREFEPLLEAIISGASDLVQADGVTLHLMDPAQGALAVKRSRDLDKDYTGYRVRIGEGLTGLVAQTGEPRIIPDYATWEGRLAIFADDPFGCVMAVPLKSQEHVLGVISLHRQRGHAVFMQDELVLASLFAAQAAISLENVRLLDALQTRLQAQKVLTEDSATLIQTTDRHVIVNQAAQTAVRALKMDFAFVLTLDSDNTLVTRAFAGDAPEAVQTLRLPIDAHSAVGRAYLGLEPVVWSDSDPPSLLQVHPLAQRTGLRGGISVPMLVGDRAVGVISVITRDAPGFAAAEVQTLAQLGNQTASALERAQYYAQVQQRASELNHLFEGYRAMGSTLDPDQVITRVMEQFVHALDVTSAYFIRFDSQRRQLVQTHSYASPYARPAERSTDAPIPSASVAQEIQEVLARRVRITNITDADVSPAMRGYMNRYEVQTILRVPLVAGDQVLGYISLWETRAPRDWSVEDVRFVQTLASQAAVSLVNAQLYLAEQNRTRELQALHEASRLINSTLDMRTICEQSVDALRDILGYTYVSIYFIEHDRLNLQVQRGYQMVLDNIPLDSGVMARAVQTRATVFLEDVSTEAEFLAALSEAQSEIAIPLLAGERVLGVLNVETKRGAAPPTREILTTADVQLLTTFANQLVVAIENARLFQETQQGLAQVRTLHVAGQAVNAELELDAVLEQVAQQFVIALKVDFCTLLQYDAPHDELVVLYDLDPEPRAHTSIGERFHLESNPHMRKILESYVPQVYRTDDPELPQVVRADLQRYMCLTELVLPLRRRGTVIGLIELGDRKQMRRFQPHEIRLAESLANQAAIALDNAHLYRAARERIQETETLYRFARELGGTLDIETLGNRALEAVRRLADYDVGEVSLVRPSDGALVPLVMSGAPELSEAERVLSRGVGITGWVVEHGRAVRVGDVTRDPRYYTLSAHIMSEICLPLRAGERIIGVLNLEAKAPNAFDAHTEELLTVFANQLAITIENARLYEQTKRDSEVKAALLRELSHRVKNNLAAITSLLYMALDEPPESREQILGETLGRVQSMALAHALLARSGDAHVNLVDLGRQVLHDTVRNLGHPGAMIQVEAQGDAIQVGARQTTTLALVLNELATNSLRHGLVASSHRNGALAEPMLLRFEAKHTLHGIECFIEDNGTGLAQTFTLESGAGLGLNLVRTLVEKDLHGQFQLEPCPPWTRATIRFRLDGS